MNYSNFSANNWEKNTLFENDIIMFRALLQKFSTVQSTVSHLITIHNETCGCHIGNSHHEASNKIWNQKKVQFMELQKISGLDFEDYLNRVLRLLVTANILNVDPLPESEFWLTLRVMMASTNQTSTVTSHNKLEEKYSLIEEDLNDIHNYIASEIMNEAPLSSLLDETTSTSVNNHATSTVVETAATPSDEITKLRRSEKHLAPMDITGLSPSYKIPWYCKHCEILHGSKYECRHYEYIHRPRYIITDSPDTPHGLPSNHLINNDNKILTKIPLKKSTRFGPIEGKECNESDLDFDEDRSGIWILHKEDGTRKCLINVQNWPKLVTSAISSSDANVIVTSSNDKLYLLIKENIEANVELKFYNMEDPQTEFWTSWSQAWSNQLKCSRCSVNGQFNKVSDYRTHISLWHDLIFYGNPLNRIYYCPDCHCKRIGAKEIIFHCKDQHDKLPFVCKHCKKRFETYNSLLKHKNRIHVKDKPLKKSCETCGKVYWDMKAWKFHIRQVHEKSEHLQCNPCESYFSSRYALNRHVREVHNQSQEHQCPKCHRHFSQPSNLKQHMLIHLGVKPFVCKQAGCKSAFTTKQCLQVHYRKVHNYSDDDMPTITKLNVKIDKTKLEPATYNSSSSNDSVMEFSFSTPSTSTTATTNRNPTTKLIIY